MTTRRSFLGGAAVTAADAALHSTLPVFAQSATGQTSGAPADFHLEIAEVEWELAAHKKIRTWAYNGQIPGPLLRVTEGKPVSIEIANRTDHPEIVHWHGQWIPVAADGAAEEGSPMIPSGASTRITFTPRPAGLHWYHTHAPADRNLSRGLYTGQFGVLQVAPRSGPGLDPGHYDQEQFIVLHDWDPYYASSDDGSLMVNYASGSINGRLLGHGEPIPVRPGQRVLFQILNASATEPHWLSLPGHRFQVLALDGAPVATQATVPMLRLGPAERVTAIVTMDHPGVWVLGEVQRTFRDAGMGIVVEYAGATGEPQSTKLEHLTWDYRVFGSPTPAIHKPDLTIPLVFTSRFKGHGALDQWMINGKSYPRTQMPNLHAGLRHRLVFINHSTDNHPVHLHRHNFELVSISGVPLSGVHKDVVVVDAGTTVEADLIADNPGNTLFHCHQQDHMDMGFMGVFRYA